MRRREGEKHTRQYECRKSLTNAVYRGWTGAGVEAVMASDRPMRAAKLSARPMLNSFASGIAESDEEDKQRRAKVRIPEARL